MQDRGVWRTCAQARRASFGLRHQDLIANEPRSCVYDDDDDGKGGGEDEVTCEL